jgi:hypothetical protein
MKKTVLKHGLLAVIAVASVLVVAPLTVKAETTDTTTNQTSRDATMEHRETAQKDAEARREAAQAKLDEAKAKAEAQREATKTRLQDAKLRVCEKRQTVVSNIMKRISDRGQKQIDLFSGIAERTQAFYEKKGKTLANYDALVADVVTKKVAAEEAVAMVTSQGTDFKCDGDDPKGVAAGFKDHHRHVIVALKEYKTSVKNLIVGVKSVQGVTSSESERN